MRNTIVHLSLCFTCSAYPQQKLNDLKLGEARNISSVTIDGHNYALKPFVSIISYRLGKQLFTPLHSSACLNIGYDIKEVDNGAFHFVLHFKNISGDTLRLDNVYPFVDSLTEALITGLSDHDLSPGHTYSCLEEHL